MLKRRLVYIGNKIKNKIGLFNIKIIDDESKNRDNNVIRF